MPRQRRNICDATREDEEDKQKDNIVKHIVLELENVLNQKTKQNEDTIPESEDFKMDSPEKCENPYQTSLQTKKVDSSEQVAPQDLMQTTGF